MKYASLAEFVRNRDKHPDAAVAAYQDGITVYSSSEARTLEDDSQRLVVVERWDVKAALHQVLHAIGVDVEWDE